MNPDVHSQLAVSRLASSRHRKSRRHWRWVVNLWLVFHLVAIIIAPAAMDPSSELTRSVYDAFQPYLDALFLNHGYHFFAPEPEESTLLSFEAERRTGRSSAGESRTEQLSPVCSTTGTSC